MKERNYQEIVVRFPLRDGETMAPKGSVMSLDDGLARAFQTIVDYGEVVVPITSGGKSGVNIDSPNLKTITFAYDSKLPLVATGSLVIVNEPQVPLLDSLLDASTVIPAVMPGVLNDKHDQTRRLTVGEGIQDPVAGRVFDKFYTALQNRDFEALLDIYDPDVRIFSVVDDRGDAVCIEGRNNVIKNQKARWNYWIETYGPVKHKFITTFISTNMALIRFHLADTGIRFGSMYTMSEYKITSMRHMKENDRVDDWGARHIEASEAYRWAQM